MTLAATLFLRAMAGGLLAGLLAGAAKAQPVLVYDRGAAVQVNRYSPGNIRFSPDNQYLLLKGDNLTAVYDVATGLPLLRGPARADSLSERLMPALPRRRVFVNEAGRYLWVQDLTTERTQEVPLDYPGSPLLTPRERAEQTGQAASSYQQPVFGVTDDGRRVYGRLRSERLHESVFRVVEVGTGKLLFNQSFVERADLPAAAGYEPVYYHRLGLVTLPQAAGLVVYNLAAGTQLTIPYPTGYSGSATDWQVSADGHGLLLWGPGFGELYELPGGTRLWQHRGGLKVASNPTAPLFYVQPFGQPDSTFMLRPGPFARLPFAGWPLRFSADGRLAYGPTHAEGSRYLGQYALFDQDMTVLRPLNACTPAVRVQRSPAASLLVLAGAGVCFATQPTQPTSDDSQQLWDGQHLVQRRLELPPGHRPTAALLREATAWRGSLVSNDHGRPRCLTDSASLPALPRSLGPLCDLQGRYALFGGAATGPGSDSLTVLRDFGRRVLAVAAPQPVWLAALDSAHRQVLAVGRPATGGAATLRRWSLAGQALPTLALALPRPLAGPAPPRLRVSASGRWLQLTTTRYYSDGNVDEEAHWLVELATGRPLGLARAAEDGFAFNGPETRVVTFTTGKVRYQGQLLKMAPGQVPDTCLVREVAGWRRLRRFAVQRLHLRGELLLGFWSRETKGDLPGSQQFYPAGPSQLALLNWSTGDTLFSQSIRHDRITVGDLSPDGRWLTYADRTGTLHLVSVAARREVARLPGGPGPITSLQFTADNARLLSSGSDGVVRVWSVTRRALVGSLVTLDADNYLASTPDGYYRCPKSALARFGFQLRTHAYGAEQFDLRYNRPDKVLAAFGADSTLVQGYRAAWQKRVRRAGLSPAQLAGTAPVPTLALARPAALPAATAEAALAVPLLLADSLATLDHLLVWANGVALYGRRGLALHEPGTHRLARTVQVSLGAGLNCLEFAVRNAQGVESYRRRVVVTRTSAPAAPGRVYFVGLGVSRYADARLNLPLAAKDVRDLARAVRQRYPTAVIDTLTDARVTRQSVQALRGRLLATGLEDRVLLAVAGHGVLDKKLTFYFAPHDMDVADPARRGIAYDDLEGLLDSIPARRRLLLLDACHSGEVDRDATPTPPAPGPARPLLAATGRGLVEDSAPVVGLQNSFQLMQDLFADLSRGTGTQVIAAAAGNSLAYEQASLRNGVFTHCVLDYLTHHPPGTVRINALREAVAAQVAALTQGAQRPTARAANNEFDWEF